MDFALIVTSQIYIKVLCTNNGQLDYNVMNIFPSHFNKKISKQNKSDITIKILYSFGISKYFHLLIAPIEGFITLIG